MYNGIGITTARGTGTNGYVQTNLSHLLLSRKKIEYNAEADLKRAEAEINRRPNEDLLDHQRKRVIEMKCAEFEMLMENKGFEEEEIQKKISDYRRLLLSQLESGELNVDDEISKKDTHSSRKIAAAQRCRMKDAFGIKNDFVPGSSMQNMNKNDPLATDDAKTKAEKERAEQESAKLEALAKKLQKRKEKEKKKKKKRALKKKLGSKKRRTDSSSSSSSSTSDSDSVSSSSSSSTDSSESDSSDSGKDERRKRKRAAKKSMIKKSKDGSRGDRIKKEMSSDEEEERRVRRKMDEERLSGKRDLDGRRRDEKLDRGVRKSRGEHDDDSRRKEIRVSRSPEDRKRRRRDSSGDGRSEKKRSEVKQEPLSGEEGGNQVSFAGNREEEEQGEEYVDSDLDEETRSRMKSIVKIVKK